MNANATIRHRDHPLCIRLHPRLSASDRIADVIPDLALDVLEGTEDDALDAERASGEDVLELVVNEERACGVASRLLEHVLVEAEVRLALACLRRGEDAIEEGPFIRRRPAAHKCEIGLRDVGHGVDADTILLLDLTNEVDEKRVPVERVASLSEGESDFVWRHAVLLPYSVVGLLLSDVPLLVFEPDDGANDLAEHFGRDAGMSLGGPVVEDVTKVEDNRVALKAAGLAFFDEIEFGEARGGGGEVEASGGGGRNLGRRVG